MTTNRRTELPYACGMAAKLIQSLPQPDGVVSCALQKGITEAQRGGEPSRSRYCHSHKGRGQDLNPGPGLQSPPLTTAPLPPPSEQPTGLSSPVLQRGKQVQGGPRPGPHRSVTGTWFHSMPLLYTMCFFTRLPDLRATCPTPKLHRASGLQPSSVCSVALLGSLFLMNPSCFPLTRLYQIRFPLSACFLVLHRVPRAGLASREQRQAQLRPPGAGRAGPLA